MIGTECLLLCLEVANETIDFGGEVLCCENPALQTLVLFSEPGCLVAPMCCFLLRRQDLLQIVVADRQR
jgi:hypothetical protein